MARPDASNGNGTARHVETRLTRLEGAVENIQGRLSHIDETLDRISVGISTAQRPNWSLLLQGAFLIIALGGLTVAPLHWRVGSNEAMIEKVEKWQYDYQLGKIPSPSEPKIAAIDKTFAEVETQFRAFKDRIAETDNYTRERANDNSRQIEENGKLIRELAVAVAQINERTAGLRGGGVK